MISAAEHPTLGEDATRRKLGAIAIDALRELKFLNCQERRNNRITPRELAKARQNYKMAIDRLEEFIPHTRACIESAVETALWSIDR